MRAFTLALVTVAIGMLGAGSATAHAMHGMHGMHALADTTTDYKCPACRMSTMKMGYDNANFVELAKGQRVYACGMEARSFPSYPTFKSTDAAYIAANMAEFIVNKTDTESYAKCTNACPECLTGTPIVDPISGDVVTAANFQFVCLREGQKIYFASETTKHKYLTSVNAEVRFLVDKTVCKGATCADAMQITALSAAAKAMVPDLTASLTATSSDAPLTPAPAATDAIEDTFCAGEGSVMFNGFQSTINGSCVRLFFQPWVLNSAFKYVLGFLGCFALALSNECLVQQRERIRQQLVAARKLRPTDKTHKWLCKLLLALLYMAQMTIAYFAMLVVMSYESGLFIALILGFGAGFLWLKDLDVDVTNERGVWRYTDPSTVRIRVGGMTCMKNCGTSVEAALLATPGVTNAFVAFDEHAAYVAGTASVTTLIDAVEAIGYTAEVDGNGGSSAGLPSNV